MDYRRAVKAGSVGATIADALEIYRRGPNSGAPLADDPTPEDNARRIQEIRDKILVKVRNKRNFLDPAAVDDKRGVPEFPFGKPMTWKKKPIKRRAMVGSSVPWPRRVSRDLGWENYEKSSPSRLIGRVHPQGRPGGRGPRRGRR